jgi:hypothetical protein
MPFHLWPKRKPTKDARLESRVRRLERNPKHFVTWPELWNFWNSMTAGTDLVQRVGDLEAWHADTDGMIADLAQDLAAMERKLNTCLPPDDNDDDEDDKVLEQLTTATERSVSPEPFSYKNVGPLAAASKLSTSKLPTTFTRRNSGSTERTALDASSLRLSWFDL